MRKIARKKQLREELVTVCGHAESFQQPRESGCSFPAAVRCLGANLSGEAVRYLESRVINEGRAEFGYGGGGRRMINLNELSCRLHINCRGRNVWLTEGCSLLKNHNKKRLHLEHLHQPPLQLQIHLNG